MKRAVCWDGDTLVVETTNFLPRGAFRNANASLLQLADEAVEASDCHEGNHAITNILNAAHAAERGHAAPATGGERAAAPPGPAKR